MSIQKSHWIRSRFSKSHCRLLRLAPGVYFPGMWGMRGHRLVIEKDLMASSTLPNLQERIIYYFSSDSVCLSSPSIFISFFLFSLFGAVDCRQPLPFLFFGPLFVLCLFCLSSISFYLFCFAFEFCFFVYQEAHIVWGLLIKKYGRI